MSTPSLRRSKRRASSSASQLAPGLEAPASQAASARTPRTKTSSTAAPPAKRTKVQPNPTAKESVKAPQKARKKEKQEGKGIKDIAAIEDKIRREQRALAMNAERPDIATFEMYKEPTPDCTEAMDADDLGATNSGVLGAGDIPNTLVLGTNSDKASDGGRNSPDTAEESSDNGTTEDLLDDEELKIYRELEAKMAKKRKASISN
ncbi:hypothetical protein EST38_g9286 [Candolleomyces aberdarensis]|uniref:Uncharacterized protein n=1 Tax=Candolleomyces aberdarensis TaxID=2316362 RepID=A0A4Q2DB46_9AGAR|nr:hypothetical protein EST38_g9286 [Candolleomyces aberdarensis]